MLIECPECGAKISSAAPRCVHCGCEISVCPECGRVEIGKVNVCQGCGYALSSAFDVSLDEKIDLHTARRSRAKIEEKVSSIGKIINITAWLGFAVCVSVILIAVLIWFLKAKTHMSISTVESAGTVYSLIKIFGGLGAFFLFFAITLSVCDCLKEPYSKFMGGLWLRRKSYNAIEYAIRPKGEFIKRNDSPVWDYDDMTAAAFIADEKRSAAVIIVKYVLCATLAVALVAVFDALCRNYLKTLMIYNIIADGEYSKYGAAIVKAFDLDVKQYLGSYSSLAETYGEKAAGFPWGYAVGLVILSGALSAVALVCKKVFSVKLAAWIGRQRRVAARKAQQHNP